MDVKISNKLILCDKRFFAKLLDIDTSRHSLSFGREFYVVDLRGMKSSELDQLQSITAANVELSRDIKSLYKDITNFKYLRDNKDGAKLLKARKVTEAKHILVNYMDKFCPRKYLFEKMDNGDQTVTVCYYVDEIRYEPASGSGWNRKPENIQVDLCYMEFGQFKSKTKHIDSGGCLGMNAREIILEMGLCYETDLLNEDYEIYLERYESWWDKIGLQMLATGIADYKGVDGNDDDDDNCYYSWRSERRGALRLDKDGEPTRCVIDVFRESEKKESDKSTPKYNKSFWDRQKSSKLKGEWDEEEVEELSEDDTIKQKISIPIHPFLICFDMKRHKRMRVHVGNLEKYEYNDKIRDSLVLPETNSKLIDVLLSEKESTFKDIIKGKTGGIIILCQGVPGTGKTLTAEVYAETMKRPLYNIQCAQLGTDADELESNLMKVLNRGRRWDAVILLDEADVYVHRRGDDLVQNAIVGVFLRVLEYQSGVLFLTTNRGDLVDDAILSRCTARIPYTCPDVTQQHKIWRVIADANEIKLSNRTIKNIVDAHPRLSGRDIKNLLKISAMVAHDRGVDIDEDLVTEMKQFKPTFDNMESPDV